jgi:uncharacterized Zn-binding protein involved in type VI secretion
MAEVARHTDDTIGICYVCEFTPQRAGTITGHSTDVIVNGLGVARLGDIVTASCGHTGTINTASSTVYANGIKVARKGDSFTGNYVGTIIEGSPNVNAGG